MTERPFDGRRVIVTGASGEIGGAISRYLAERGANLALVGRNSEALARIAEMLTGGPHDVVPLDVSDDRAWTAAGGVLAPHGVVHGIVASAAILGPIGPVGSWDVDEFRLTLEINLVGSLLPIISQLNGLKRARGSVVLLSGGGATSTMQRYDAYAVSKAALVRMAENLAAELKSVGVRINCIAPGFIISDMHRATIAAGPDLVGDAYYDRTRRALDAGEADDPSLAASLASFLLSDESKGITGRLISARWDPWTDPSFQERLRDEQHLGTLRRIDSQFFEAVSATSP